MDRHWKWINNFQLFITTTYSVNFPIIGYTFQSICTNNSFINYLIIFILKE